MFIDPVTVAMTDEQFQDEMKQRIAQNPGKGHHSGCLLCGIVGNGADRHARRRTSSSKRMSAAFGFAGQFRESAASLSRTFLISWKSRNTTKHLRALARRWRWWLRPSCRECAVTLANRGQNVAPGYEGWEEDADGSSFSLLAT